MADLPSILASISSSGWLVRHMGQLADSRWFACLWLAEEDGMYITTDAIAVDPASALALAFISRDTARFLGYSRPLDSDITTPEFTLASLGLGPPPMTFTSPLRRKL